MSLRDKEPEKALSKSDEQYRNYGWRVVEKQEKVIACLQAQLTHQRWEAHNREEAQLQKFEELKKLGAQQLRAQDNKHRKELEGQEEAQLQKFKCEENRLKQEARDWKKSQA